MASNDYREMPFDELFHIVFTNSGDVALCGREACRAMIEWLEGMTHMLGRFGNAELGRLKMPDAYMMAKRLSS